MGTTCRRRIPALAVFALLLVLPSAAGAKTKTTPTTPATPTAPTPPPAPIAPAAGKIRLVFQKVGGGASGKSFGIAGRRFVVRGIVIPYVAGQTVKVSFYRDGRKLGVQRLS